MSVAYASEEGREGPVLRVFEVLTKPDCADKLLGNFATMSADVVQDQDGNCGYFFGRCIERDNNILIFVSIWRDLAAIKARFGAKWRQSHMPNGYEELIETCSVRHFDLSEGWHVEDI